MRKSPAAAGSTAFFVLGPCVVAGLIPWWLTGWVVRPVPYWAPLRAVGVGLILGGAAVLVHSFARFTVEGLGTPAPVAPPEHLVVGGLYRYVRNPMYLAVLAAIVGQALALAQPVLLPCAGAVLRPWSRSFAGTRSRFSCAGSELSMKCTVARCRPGGHASAPGRRAKSDRARVPERGVARRATAFLAVSDVAGTLRVLEQGPK